MADVEEITTTEIRAKAYDHMWVIGHERGVTIQESIGGSPLLVLTTEHAHELYSTLGSVLGHMIERDKRK